MRSSRGTDEVKAGLKDYSRLDLCRWGEGVGPGAASSSRCMYILEPALRWRRTLDAVRTVDEAARQLPHTGKPSGG